jgi:predicted nucleotidyltransferase
MRLDNGQQQTIKEKVVKIFGPDAVVRLFGSRVDDAGKGGDIDLLVEASEKPSDLIKKELQLYAELLSEMGDQKIDILVVYPGMKTNLVHQEAFKTGIVL